MAMLLRLYTHNWRPGACPRDPMASARGKTLWPLHPRRPLLERLGQWVPTSGAGKTAWEVARGKPHHRPEKRRVGQERIRPCRSRWAPAYKKKKITNRTKY